MYIKRLRATLEASGLLHILDSLPLPTSFELHRTTLEGNDAITFHVGNRKQSDGIPIPVWAYVFVFGNKLAATPILFREKIPTVTPDGIQEQLFPRSASSILRRATGLQPPFCFLQCDAEPSHRVSVRDMLCALILYNLLCLGHVDHAMTWTQFDIALLEALQHIEESYEYHVWRKGVANEQSDTLDASIGDDVNMATVITNGLSSSASSVQFQNARPGEVVRSLGHPTQIALKGTLAKIVRIMQAAKVHLLDKIPAAPIRITRQTTYPECYPFRLHLGVYKANLQAQTATDVDVFVYLSDKGKQRIRIRGHDANGKELSWKFDTLQRIQLQEPFSLFTRPTSYSQTTQANKIRALVQYYFALAENAGLVDKLPFDVTEGLVTTLCTACRNLEQECLALQTEVGGCSDDSVQSTIGSSRASSVVQAVEPHSTLPTIRMEANPRVLEEISSNAVPRTLVCDVTNKGDGSKMIDRATMTIDRTVQSPKLLELHEAAIRENISPTPPTGLQEDLDAHPTVVPLEPSSTLDRDASIMSRISTDVAVDPGDQIHQDRVPVEQAQSLPLEPHRRSRSPKAREVHNEEALPVLRYVEHEPDSEDEIGDPAPELGRQKSPSVISISSSVGVPPTPIDLCSDDGGDNSLPGRREHNNGIGEQVQQLQSTGIFASWLRASAQRAKRKVDERVDNEEEGLEIVEGDDESWRRASIGRLQAKRLQREV